MSNETIFHVLLSWKVSGLKCSMRARRVWTLFSSRRLLIWFGTVLCKKWYSYLVDFTLWILFPVILLFQSVLSFLSFPQALSLNLKLRHNILAISGSPIKMILILTVTPIRTSLSHRFLSLIFAATETEGCDPEKYDSLGELPRKEIFTRGFSKRRCFQSWNLLMKI